MLTWADVAALAGGGIAFGAHTVTHPVLSTLSAAEARDEIVRSKEAIERCLGRPVRLFAYPNGGPEDFDAATKRILRDAGFDGATTTMWGANDGTTDPFELRRVRYWGSDPVRGLARLVWYRVRG
jgi:peptidoglycan/xylan/chitin deacetylase (PgdA/CDA1 family)